MHPKTRRWKLSRREQTELNNRWLSFYAAASERPDAQDNLKKLVVELPPKRHKVKRCDGKPIIASEHQEQSAVIEWWALAHKQYHLPEFALFAIPNGGARDPITGSRLKAEGVRPGVLDLMLACTNGQHAGLFIEMKVGDNKPSPKQADFIEYLDRAGYLPTVHWSADSAIKEIEGYLGLVVPLP